MRAREAGDVETSKSYPSPAWFVVRTGAFRSLGRSENCFEDRCAVGLLARRQGPDLGESPGDPGRCGAEETEPRASGLQFRQRRVGLFFRRNRRTAESVGQTGVAVDPDDAGDVFVPGPTAEVPHRVDRGFGTAQRVAPEDHRALAAVACEVDDVVEVTHGHRQPPVVHELVLRGRQRLVMGCDLLIGEPVQVVIERLLDCRLAVEDLEEHGVVLQRPLPAHFGPYLEIRDVRGEIGADDVEVGRPGQGAGHQDQHIGRRG